MGTWIGGLTIGMLVFPIPSRAQQRPPLHVEYSVTELPLSPTSINESGTIAGTTMKDLSPVHAASWGTRSGLKLLGCIPSGFSTSEVASINDRGVAVGNLVGPVGDPVRAAIFMPGKTTQLNSLGNARAYGINNKNHVVGESVLANAGGTHSVMWAETGEQVNLGDCCGGVARAINDADQVVGYMWSADHRYEAFLWDTTHGIVRLTPSERFSSALAINNLGDVLVETGSGYLVYHRRDRSFSKLPLGKAAASALNDEGQIVGASGPIKDHFKAFVWDSNLGMRDLNSLIPADSDWVLERAVAINNKGQIIGWGEHHGEDCFFLLNPVRPADSKKRQR